MTERAGVNETAAPSSAVELHVRIGGRRFDVDIAGVIDCAIPLDFHGGQPNAYGVPRAEAAAVRAGAWVGDTREGGSCNFEEVRIIPHCNGTHTEGVGHVSDARISVHDMLGGTFLPATLVSVTPFPALSCDEHLSVAPDAGDRVITAHALRAALAGCDTDFLSALVIRTLPNPLEKRARDYLAEPAPFFTLDAMRLVRERGVEHLLVDLPSLDRASDEGKLGAHRVFWELPAGTHDVDAAARSMRTVSELLYVPDAARDGRYLLTIHLPSFVADAAPSRPLLYPLRERADD
jgi:kynurenine formamidase